MSMEVISNSTRYFKSFIEAVSQPRALLELTENVGINGSTAIINTLYDPALIKNDESYCTDNLIHLQRSLKIIYFFILDRKNQSKFTLVDIGCGQGELVKILQSKGIDAWGFDPCLRIESHKLLKSPFVPELSKHALELKSNVIPLFTMRCVLPHIFKYEQFLQDLFGNFPNAFVYLEYQSVERLIKDKSWYMFNHDHCNYFTHNSFNEYVIAKSGCFGEWDWVLLSQKTFGVVTRKNGETSKKVGKSSPDLLQQCNSVLNVQKNAVEIISNRCGNGKLWIYSAAGKGANFGFAASRSNQFDEIFALDKSEYKWRLYLEGSGIRVSNPQSLDESQRRNDLLLILNRAHFEEANSLGFTNTLSHYEIIDRI